jgi:hypothetical protein
MLADFCRQRWLLNRLDKPGILDEIIQAHSRLSNTTWRPSHLPGKIESIEGQA